MPQHFFLGILKSPNFQCVCGGGGTHQLPREHASNQKPFPSLGPAAMVGHFAILHFLQQSVQKRPQLWSPLHSLRRSIPNHWHFHHFQSDASAQGSGPHKLQIAVVGSGPAGFYTIEALQKKLKGMYNCCKQHPPPHELIGVLLIRRRNGCYWSRWIWHRPVREAASAIWPRALWCRAGPSRSQIRAKQVLPPSKEKKARRVELTELSRFDKFFEDKNLRFFGNVSVGHDISLQVCSMSRERCCDSIGVFVLNDLTTYVFCMAELAGSQESV